MSTISKACLEISKSLKNFKFNRSPNASDAPKEAQTSDQSRSSSQSASSTTRSNDASWSSNAELSVTEALTRVFRQATNRVRSFSDRSGCSQSFAVVAPSGSSLPPSTTPLSPPFLSAPPPSPATTTTNSENSNNESSESDAPPKTCDVMRSLPSENPAAEPLSTGMEDEGVWLPPPEPSTSSTGRTNSFREVAQKPNLGSEASISNLRHRKSIHDDVAFIVCPPKSLDDLFKDKEFLVKFFKYFSISQLCTLAQVCRLWREILYSDAKYWVDGAPKVICRELGQQDESVRRNFYASLERRKFDSLCLIGLLDDDINDVIRLFPYGSTGVRKLSVRCSNVSDAGLKRLLESVSSATSLELNGCNEITEAGLWTCLGHRLNCLTLADCINVADESVSAVAQLLPNLKEFNLQAYHVTDVALSAFSNKQGNCLRTLRLLSCWEITNHGIVNVIRSLPNLTVLSLSGCSKVTDDGVEVLSENLRQLRSLDLSWCSRITDASLEYIACDLCLLEELTLDRCSHVSDIGVGYLSTMTSLTHLFLRWCNQLRDFGVQRISTMKNLRVLSLAGCNMVTSAGITRLCQLSTLRELELTNCSATASSDICSFMHDKMPDCVIIE